jgi:hypothetical protein
MAPSAQAPAGLRRPVWLGIVVGWLVQLGLKTLLPIVVMVGLRYWQLLTGMGSPSVQSPPRSSDPAWYDVQAAIFLGSVLAGYLAARLTPGRPRALALGLVLLSLLTTFFEQFPMPFSGTAMLVWAAGPCLGLLAGTRLAGATVSAAGSD